MSDHAKAVEPKIRDVQERIRKMAAEDLGGQLLGIVHGPGWTTLREVALVQAALETHSRHLDELDRSLRALVKAAE
jgi:hypothetical protein